MKTTTLSLKLLLLGVFSLLMFNSCGDDDPVDNKPEMLIGKWKSEMERYSVEGQHHYYYTTYEYTPTNAYVTVRDYSWMPSGKLKFLGEEVTTYSNWTYDGHSIHQTAMQGSDIGGGFSMSVQSITANSVVFRGEKFYRINESWESELPGGTKPESMIGKWKSDIIQPSPKESPDDYYNEVYEITSQTINRTRNFYKKTSEDEELQLVDTESISYIDWIFNEDDQLYRLRESGNTINLELDFLWMQSPDQFQINMDVFNRFE